MSTRVRTRSLEDYQAATRRLARAVAVLVGVIALGALGYMYIGYAYGGGRWTAFECVYMTLVTVTTVGYGEVIDVRAVPGGREWTMVLLLFGITANLYVVSSITSLVLEGDFARIQRYRRFRRRMTGLRDHVIVCGVGTTGVHVVDELVAAGVPVVAIDQRATAVQAFDGTKVLGLVGDATEDATLREAGIERCRGVVAALDDDKTNMFVVVSARQANPNARIVTRALQPSAAEKLRRAGADGVVSTNYIGGVRLALELLQPQVVELLDAVLSERGAPVCIEEYLVAAGSALAGATLGEAGIHERTGALVLAIHGVDGKVIHAPGRSVRLAPGHKLFAISRPEAVAELRAMLEAPPASRRG